jgi:Ca2+-binding EF-hand superfamily protein
METDDEMLARVRRRINASKVRSNMTWEQLFKLMDSDGGGSLDIREFKTSMRGILKVTATSVNDRELRHLFRMLDGDGSGDIELAELLNFLQRGKRTPAEEEARKEQYVQRVRKSLNLAFGRLSTNEHDVKALFNKIDSDGGGTLSFFEFETFVRFELKVDTFSVKNADLKGFYHYLDEDGNGLEVGELLAFLKQARQRTRVFDERPKSAPGVIPKTRPTFRQTLQDKAFAMTIDPVLSLNKNYPFSTSFTNLGRTRPGVTRLAASTSAATLRFSDRPSSAPGGMHRTKSAPSLH